MLVCTYIRWRSQVRNVKEQLLALLQPPGNENSDHGILSPLNKITLQGTIYVAIFTIKSW
jgi:hypothetical protein